MVKFNLRTATNFNLRTATNDNYLGGPIPGIAPQLVGGGANTNSGSGMDGGNARSLNRFTLRKGWNGTAGNLNNAVLGPFRRVNNAGDLQGRLNVSSGGPNQVTSVRRQSLASWPLLAGSVSRDLDAGKHRVASCNPKFVYDSSDYVRFKKLQSVNRNYNDYSFGGSNNGAQVATALARL